MIRYAGNAFRVVATTFLVLSLNGACLMVDFTEDDMGSAESALVSDNRIILNRIILNNLAVERMTLDGLSLGRLSSSRLSANPEILGHLVDSEEGIEFLEYFTMCALPEGLELVVLADDGETPLYMFPGLIGMAPQWENRAPTLSEQRWVTSCLLSRVNLYGITVPVSIRGQHDALGTTADERGQYIDLEGAFFGNIFQDRDGDGVSDFDVYACRGRAKVLGESTEYLDARVCTEPDPENPGYTLCDFIDAGQCWSPEPSQPRACQRPGRAGGSFSKCRTEPRAADDFRSPGGDRYSEVITVYLPR